MGEDAYFLRRGPGRFAATARTGGAWSESAQHVSPTIGLIVHEIERAYGGDGWALARLSVDILGLLAIDEVTVDVQLLRPGRTIALVGVRVSQDGRTVVDARAWRLAPYDTSAVAGGAAMAVPGPDDVPELDLPRVWPGGYIDSLEVRRAADAVPGRGLSWVRTPVDLVAGEPASDLARWAGLLDTANGLAVRASPREWLFPNVDLTLHLHRTPVGRWLGLDTTVVFGDDGTGVTSSRAYDAAGPVGHVQQSLTIRPAG